MKLLILGGTSEASALAALLAQCADVDTMLSFAGRTQSLKIPPIAYRVGGFGGVDGLVDYLESQAVDLLVDATHPFAEIMSQHAVRASQLAGIPLISLSRPAWQAEAEDCWVMVKSMAAAALAIGNGPRRVFLTIGRLQLAAFEAAPQHFYLIRAIDPLEPACALPNHRVIYGRGPFVLADEERLLRDEKIDVAVTKNSGGAAAYAKILAARRLGIPVIMVERKAAAHGESLYDVNVVMQLILQHQARLARRGV